jgi:hypothetical protein
LKIDLLDKFQFLLLAFAQVSDLVAPKP